MESVKYVSESDRKPISKFDKCQFETDNIDVIDEHMGGIALTAYCVKMLSLSRQLWSSI